MFSCLLCFCCSQCEGFMFSPGCGLRVVVLCVFSINLLRKRKLGALLAVFLLLYPCLHLFDCVLVHMSM